MSEVIAERILRTIASESSVTARIYAPEKMGRSSEWSCKVEIQGLEIPFEQSAIGADSFQALYLALRCLSVQLDQYAERLTFEGRSDDCGILLITPWPFDTPLKAEIYRMIESKVLERLTARA